jgi:predicted RNase H-like nuclease (RuvC/YqgF family)
LGEELKRLAEENQKLNKALQSEREQVKANIEEAQRREKVASEQKDRDISQLKDANAKLEGLLHKNNEEKDIINHLNDQLKAAITAKAEVERAVTVQQAQI